MYGRHAEILIPIPFLLLTLLPPYFLQVVARIGQENRQTD
jgi:hypothetical protein